LGNTRNGSWSNAFLTVSPDGRWLSVSGGRDPVLFEVGSLTAAPSVLGRRQRLAWRKETFGGEVFQGRSAFTGDSAFFLGIVNGVSLNVPLRLYCRPLSGLPAFHLAPPSVPHWNRFATVPGVPAVVLTGWREEAKAFSHWRVDLLAPEQPAVLLGSTEHDGGLTVGSDGRLFLLSAKQGLGVYSPVRNGLRLDFAVRLPGFDNMPTLAVSGDGRRFVVRDSMSKFVYSGDATTGVLFGPWDWNIGAVNGIAIAPDSLTAAAAGSSKKVVVMDLE
jgi:hypothetical protein